MDDMNAQSATYDGPRMLTMGELAQRLGVSPRGIDCLMKQRKIPYTKLSRKMLRFDWQKVAAALEKFTVNAVGQ